MQGAGQPSAALPARAAPGQRSSRCTPQGHVIILSIDHLEPRPAPCCRPTHPPTHTQRLRRRRRCACCYTRQRGSTTRELALLTSSHNLSQMQLLARCPGPGTPSTCSGTGPGQQHTAHARNSSPGLRRDTHSHTSARVSCSARAKSAPHTTKSDVHRSARVELMPRCCANHVAGWPAAGDARAGAQQCWHSPRGAVPSSTAAAHPCKHEQASAAIEPKARLRALGPGGPYPPTSTSTPTT
jgi:hypothetical protein